MPRRLLYGITGGIAAYKAPLIIREFQKRDVLVKTVVTDNALQFVTPTTLSALSGQPVYSQMFEQDASFTHLDLPQWADALLIAPATANCLGKCAHGVADDLLTTLFAALKRPVILAPAMNHDMWVSDAAQHNVRLLQERGARIVPPDTGFLACAEQGTGRMADIETIVEQTMLCFQERGALEHKRVLVTAGATREFIDPVRFISNRSSGKMGFAVAAAFLRRGARVTLVTGPTDLIPPLEIECVRVTSAADMFLAVTELAGDSDIIIKAAAVADYTPASFSDHKIKKTQGGTNLELIRTRDILKHLGENKKPGQILIGFSAETRDHLENAAKKLRAKNLDMIVLNDVAASDAGFEVDNNRVLMLCPADRLAEFAAGDENARTHTHDGAPVVVREFPLMSKTSVAEEIVKATIQLMGS